MKKIIYGILVIIGVAVTYLIAPQKTYATDTPEGFNAGTGRGIEVVGKGEKDPTGTEPRALTIIRTTINRVLSLLGVIALILCLRGGFQMLTAAGDDAKVKTGTKILKNAAIGLVVIGLSWIIVRFIFRLILKMDADS